MANSILKLRVESEEYDAKLKKAAEGIRHLAEVAHKGGGELTGLEKAELDYIKALGDMETKSRTAAGQTRELENAFKELTVIYNNLNDVEKADEGGKALAASLETLKQRTIDSKAQMDAATKSLQSNSDSGKENAGIIGQLTDKLTVNIDAFKLLNVGLDAAKAALDVAKDAFFNNEEQLDTWGRVVESSQSLYEGFLNALNTGDISGYLQNISSITRAAQNAYDALDALSTFNAFNQVNVEKTRTGMTESIVDFREGNGSKEAVKAAGDAYKKELEERKKLEKEAYLAKVKEVAAQRGVSGDDLVMALSGSYGSYQSLKALPMSGSRIVNYGGGMFGGGGSYEEAIPANRQEKLGAALRKLNDTELQSLQALGAQAERTGNEIASVDRQLTRVLNGRQPGAGGSGGGKGGSTTTTLAPTYAADSIAAQEALVASLTKQWREASSELREGYLKDLTDAKNKLEGMKLVAPKGVDTSGSPVSISTETIIPSIDEIRNYLEKNPIKIPIEAASDKIKGIMKTASITADVVGSIGDAFNAIEDPAAKVAGTIAQAIASVALGYATATANAGSMGPWAWVAFAATGLAEMLTMISTIHSATGYASGGIVGGNSFSGDNMPAMVGNTVVGLNAGELILNKSQQNNIASQLMQAGGGGRLVAKLRGRDILISLERELSETGKGQLATWR